LKGAKARGGGEPLPFFVEGGVMAAAVPVVEDATKYLNALRSLKDYDPPFEIMGNYRLIDDGEKPEATIILKAKGRELHEAATGVGPVDALANVLKKALTPLFSQLQRVRLLDFSSRIFDPRAGTEAKVEVRIIFGDGERLWEVHAFSENINKASFWALVDGFEYAILLDQGRGPFNSASEGRK